MYIAQLLQKNDFNKLYLNFYYNFIILKSIILLNPPYDHHDFKHIHARIVFGLRLFLLVVIKSVPPEKIRSTGTLVAKLNHLLANI
jgi:hypothetical protein